MKIFFIYLYLFCLFFGILTHSSISQNLSKIDSLEQEIILTNSPIDKVEILLLLSDELNNVDQSKALDYAQAAYDLAVELENEKLLLKTMVNLSEYYRTNSMFKESLNLASKSRNLSEELDLQEYYAESIMIIGKCYGQLEDYVKSSEILFEALEIYESSNNPIGISNAMSALGISYGVLGKLDKALDYSLNSYKVAQENNYIDGIARALGNIAITYRKMGNYEKSIKYLNEAIKFSKEKGIKRWEGANYQNMAMIYRSQMMGDSVFYYAFKAKDIYEELKNYNGLGKAFNLLSSTYREIGDFENAEFYSLRAFEIGDNYNFKSIKYFAASNLHDLSILLGDTNNAYMYKCIQYNVKESVDENNSLAQISKLELLHEFNKKEQEDKILSQRRNFIILILILSLITGLLIVLFIVYRYRVKEKLASLERKKLEDQLEFKNKELATIVMSLLKKNEMLVDIADKLIEIEGKAAKEETKTAILKISRDLQKFSESEIWKEFETRFKQVHISFYDNLLKQYPDLTQNDQRLCAFLKLNMSTKEISELSGQSINALEKSRFRLRKKLGISRQEINLTNFISRI